MALAEAAVALGFPQGLLAGWSKALPGADAIGLAVNREGSSVRLYVQYWEAVRALVEAGQAGPLPLYAGFKALSGGVLRTDAYLCHPAAPREVFWPPMRDGLARLGVAPDLAEAAFAPLTAGNCIFTETQSDGRASWLATVRRAELDSGAVARCLAPLAARAEGMAAALAAGAAPVHLAGGEDGTKGAFLTVYLEAEPEDIVTLVSLPSP